MNVSILIPVYNKEFAISKVLDALLPQVLNNDEIIVLNDGSEDKSSEILKQYESKIIIIERSRKAEEKNYFRIASGRNYLVAHARNEHLIFLSGDCIPRPDFVKLHRENMEKVEPKTIIRGIVNPGAPFIEGYSDQWINFITGNVSIFKKDFIIVGGLDDMYDGGWGYEDSDFGLRAVLKYGYKLYCINAIIDHIDHQRVDQVGENNHILFNLKKMKITKPSNWVDILRQKAMGA